MRPSKHLFERVQRYANGSAPFLGIPVFSVADGKYVTAVFRRDHLQTALSAPISKVSYDESNHALVLNGTTRACYRLRDLGHGNTGWQIREALTDWARRKRKSQNTRKTNPETRRVVKLQEAVRKLERQRNKIYANRPHSPMQLTVYDRQPASQRDREQESKWREQKSIRRKLGQLVRRERKTWAQFYQDVAELIGRNVGETERHDRVCNRKNGPDRVQYLTYLCKHVWMAEKPYERTRLWEPFKVYEWAGEDNGLNRFQQHRRAQLQYLAAMRERTAVQSQIDAHLAEIAEIQRGLSNGH